MRSILALIIALTFPLAAHAATGPYDEAADARNEIKSALTAAKDAKVAVLLVFGANWCGDCKALDLSFKSGSTAPLIEKSYKVVKVNVGRFDRNVDLAETYGVPLKQGIPAIAVLNSDGKAVFATRAGELADARNMGDRGIHDFFARLADGVK
jgi:protein disulfide-isomerase